MDEQTARRDLLRICQLMYERSYVVSSDGNVSVLLEDGRVLATPTMTCKGRMTEDLLAITDLEGRSLNGSRASSELAMHLLIYRERPDVKAPLAEYGTPSTEELTNAMRPLVKHHNALLMANHGAVAYGSDLWQAFDRLETLEHTAKIAILSRALGGSRNLPPDAIEKLINVREAAGYLDEGARCQACGYLHETNLACPSGERPAARSSSYSSANGAGKVSLTREELVELLSQASRLND